ncbi:MAG: 2-oxo acid dehydrogenase subunit E2 [Erysipelotrichaceae bacterium]|nr:2-oxo acid dehydrogenase subunit E2 [Erysipelotrichaceae bacterium]
MAKEVLMPKLSSTMDKGHVTEWFKKVGDPIKVGEVLFEVMTDKIAIEVEAYDAGIVLGRYVEVGQVVPVNTVIAHIGQAGEKVEAPKLDAPVPSIAAPVGEVAKVETVVSAPVVSQALPSDGFGVRATPAARKAARDRGITVEDVFSSTAGLTRVHLKDVEAYQPGQRKAAVVLGVEKVIPWTGIRKLIADQMLKSHTTVPSVTINAEVNVDSLLRMRTELLDKIEKEAGVRITVTHLLAYFVTKALVKHPGMNARALEDGIHVMPSINLGIAVALENGLIVPNVKNAQALSLKDLSKAIKTQTGKPKANTLMPDDISGGTFTITSLGTTAVIDFNPIINVPEICILGVGRTVERVEFDANNNLVKVNKMTLSLSFDHRATDGYPAALFLTDLVYLIEHPLTLLAD